MRISALAENRFHFSVLRVPVLAMCIASGLLLSGCAGISGVQSRITKTDLTSTICPDEDQLHRFALTGTAGDGVRGGLTQKAYRDMIINNCINAANDNFYNFATGLRKESTIEKLTVDGAILTLSGLAAVGNGAKNSAAAIEGLVGFNAAINKDVYYDQTLPALVSAMGINRNEILKRIRDNQRSDADTYTLGAAGSDVQALESASDINIAIKQLISVTEKKEKDTADRVLPPPKVMAGVTPPDEDAQMANFLGKYVKGLLDSGKRDELIAIAKKLGMTDADITPLNNQTLAGNIGDLADAEDTASGLDGLKAKLGDTVKPEAWQ